MKSPNIFSSLIPYLPRFEMTSKKGENITYASVIEVLPDEKKFVKKVIFLPRINLEDVFACIHFVKLCAMAIEQKKATKKEIQPYINCLKYLLHHESKQVVIEVIKAFANKNFGLLLEKDLEYVWIPYLEIFTFLSLLY